ncbi:MAG: hypothetical protein ABIF40_00545 [archaeon]
MKKLFLVLILLFMLPCVMAVEHYYQIDIDYNNGELSLDNIEVVASQVELASPEGFYIAQINSVDDEVINTVFFGIDTEILVDYIDEETGEISGGGLIELTESEATLYVAYDETASGIVIYDWDLNEKLVVDLSGYSTESAVMVDEELDVEEPEEVSNVWLYAILIVAIVGLLLLIFLMLKKKK